MESDEPRAKRILQRDRDCLSTEEVNTDRETIDNNKKSKSFEERAEQYAKARHRIFDEVLLFNIFNHQYHITTFNDIYSKENRNH